MRPAEERQLERGREASERSGGDRVPVHGGLAEPVDRTLSLKDRKHFLREARSLPPVRVSRADLSAVYRIADGTLSPLEGPMREAAWRRALEEAAPGTAELPEAA